MAMTLSTPMGPPEPFTLIQELEQRLRNQQDRMEHLKLSVSEALSSAASSTGFSYMEQSSTDLKMSFAEHAAFLCDLNERMISIQISARLLMQANVKSRQQRRRQPSQRYSTGYQFCDGTQSELGCSPAWQRRSSDAASDMSCAW